MKNIFEWICIIGLLSSLFNIYSLKKSPKLYYVLNTGFFSLIVILCWYGNFVFIDALDLNGNPWLTILIIIQCVIFLISFFIYGHKKDIEI